MKFWKLFAICPFWQPNRKTASTAPRTSLRRHSGRTPQRRIRAIPWRSAAFAPSTTPASPHSAAPALFHTIAPVRFMMPGTHRPITPYPCLFTTLHLCRSMAPCAYRPTAPYLRHTMLPSPTPLTVPRQVRLTPPSALLQSCWKSGNKKVIKIATFLRLAIAVDVQITDRAPKMKQNDRSVPHFHFAGDKKEPLIAKKLQKRQDFCFRKANYRNRSRFRNQTIAKRGGQIPR